MRDLRAFDKYRVEPPEMVRVKDYDPARDGCFVFNHGGAQLHVIASSGGGWDHVSVSLADRCPTWLEMEAIARLLFRDGEVAMQLHVPAKDHINEHPFVLHWWRPRLKRIPLPPKGYV